MAGVSDDRRWAADRQVKGLPVEFPLDPHGTMCLLMEGTEEHFEATVEQLIDELVRQGADRELLSRLDSFSRLLGSASAMLDENARHILAKGV
jgi:hypothetical protein